MRLLIALAVVWLGLLAPVVAAGDVLPGGDSVAIQPLGDVYPGGD